VCLYFTFLDAFCPESVLLQTSLHFCAENMECSIFSAAGPEGQRPAHVQAGTQWPPVHFQQWHLARGAQHTRL